MLLLAKPHPPNTVKGKSLRQLPRKPLGKLFSLLRCQTPISQLRGKWFEYRGVRLMPTFHPAYLLRNPGDKRLVWQDIKQVMAALGIAVPPR